MLKWQQNEFPQLLMIFPTILFFPLKSANLFEDFLTHTNLSAALCTDRECVCFSQIDDLPWSPHFLSSLAFFPLIHSDGWLWCIVRFKVWTPSPCQRNSIPASAPPRQGSVPMLILPVQPKTWHVQPHTLYLWWGGGRTEQSQGPLLASCLLFMAGDFTGLCVSVLVQYWVSGCRERMTGFG